MANLKGESMRFKELKENTINGITVISPEDFIKYGYAAADTSLDSDIDLLNMEDKFDAEGDDLIVADYNNDDDDEGDDDGDDEEIDVTISDYEDDEDEDEYEKTLDDDDIFVDGLGESYLKEDDFGLGSRYRVADDEEMQDYLKRIKTNNKEKRDSYQLPHIHASNIKIKDENGKDYDLEALKLAITRRPSSLLKQNEKMKHSDGSASIFYNVGLPALKGLAVNEETNEFVIIDTCPGAGACKIFCYAKKGSYIQYSAVSLKQTQTLNFLMNDPEGFKKVLSDEISAAVKKFSKDDVQVMVRWHDSGDFFSNEYLSLAYSIATDFPDVKFYAYTKLSSVAKSEKPKNFIINFSEGALPSEQKKIDLVNIKNSRVVPKDLFFDLISREGNKIIKDEKGRTQFKDEESLELFKQRVADKYGLDPRTIITYDEMMDIPEGDRPIYNVIVTPGSGDDSAARHDVLSTLLLFH